MDKALLDTDIFSETLKGIDQSHYQRIQTLGYNLKLDNWRT